MRLADTLLTGGRGGGKPHMSTVERSYCLLSDWSQQSVVGKGAQTTGMTTAGLTHRDFKLYWRVVKHDIKEANLTFIDIACFACNLYELVPSFSLNTTWLCPASLCLSEHNPAGTRPAPTLSLARRAGQVHDGGHTEAEEDETEADDERAGEQKGSCRFTDGSDSKCHMCSRKLHSVEKTAAERWDYCAAGL